MYLLIYVFEAVLGLCCSEGFSLVVCTDFSLQWFLLLQSRVSRAWGFKLQPVGSLLLGSRAWAQQSWLSGFVALGHVGSSRIRDQTRVSCIVRGFFTTEPPGKPCPLFLCHSWMKSSWIHTSLTFFIIHWHLLLSCTINSGHSIYSFPIIPNILTNTHIIVAIDKRTSFVFFLPYKLHFFFFLQEKWDSYWTFRFLNKCLGQTEIVTHFITSISNFRLKLLFFKVPIIKT